MLFDVQAALAEILNMPAGHCDTRDTCDLKAQKSQKSQSQPVNVPTPTDVTTSHAHLASVPMAQPSNRDNRGYRSPHPVEITQPPSPASPSRQDDARPDEHGYCHSWTGRVVRLDEWRQLGAWDRHGPAGRLFCGICKAWVSREGGCGQVGCWKAHGGAA